MISRCISFLAFTNHFQYYQIISDHYSRVLSLFHLNSFFSIRFIFFIFFSVHALIPIQFSSVKVQKYTKRVAKTRTKKVCVFILCPCMCSLIYIEILCGVKNENKKYIYI